MIAPYTFPSYKLTYFPGRGRAEVARQLLHLANAPFEDVRITQEEWVSLKPNTSFGQIPILEVDGKPLPQSHAINRYLAKQFGFAGATPFEMAWVDAVADLHKDHLAEIASVLPVLWGFIPGDKDQLVNDVLTPARDKYYAQLDKVAKDNGSNGHFVGASLTWVDLLIGDHVAMLLHFLPGFLDYYPTVLKCVKKIESTPKVKEWIEKRPDTKF